MSKRFTSSKTKIDPAVPRIPQASTPCRCCGAAVHLERGEDHNRWQVCVGCSGREGRVEAVQRLLDHLGIREKATDPIVRTAMSRLPWRAQEVLMHAEGVTSWSGNSGTTTSGRRIIDATGRDLVTLPAGEGSERPWEHVGQRAVLDAIEAARTEAVERTIPRPCADAPACSGCGINASVAWIDTQRRDPAASPSSCARSAANRCGTCAAYGSPSTPTTPPVGHPASRSGPHGPRSVRCHGRRAASRRWTSTPAASAHGSRSSLTGPPTVTATRSRTAGSTRATCNGPASTSGGATRAGHRRSSVKRLAAEAARALLKVERLRVERAGPPPAVMVPGEKAGAR